MAEIYETPPTAGESEAAENRGRARDRHRRRQERRAMAVPSGRRPTLPPQLTPTGAFRLPQITLPERRVLTYAGGAAALLIGILVVLSRLTGGAGAPQTPPNALWLGTEWTYGLDERAVLPDLVQRLREHRVGTVYAWVSWLKDDLTWGGRRDGTNEFSEVEETVTTFVTNFKEQYPESRLLAWISVPADLHDLADADTQQAIADLAQQSVAEMNFDGVHLNVEPVWNNDTTFISLLNKVRQTVGEDVFVSAAIPPDWSPLGADIPVPPLIVPGTVWDTRYKQSVALLVDELAIMSYNSGLTRANNNTPADYSQWVAYQVKAYADAVAALDTGSGAGTVVTMGIPTYEAEPPGHDPLIENVPSAVDGVRMGMEQAGANARYVQGVALYADWETDETEWAQLMVRWLNPDA